MSKNKIFYLFIIGIIIILFEGLSFIYFKIISNDDEKLLKYIEKRKGTLSYKYFKDIGLVLPKKNITLVHYTSEFTDKFLFKDILGLGFGFPDDGIDNRKFKAVAIGDSFTRGVGSENNLKNGWVELVEKKNKSIDIINLGHLGWGINDQKYNYNKIRKVIDHNIVIYNFFSGGDYADNLSDLNYSYYIKKVHDSSGEIEAQKVVDDLNIRHGYKYHLEYLSRNKIKSYSIYFVLKNVDYLITKKLFPQYKFKYNIPDIEARLKVVDDEMFKLSKILNGKLICQKKYCYREFIKDLEDQDIMNKVLINSANKINKFYDEVINDNKDFILILHPSARNLYPNATNFDYNKLNTKLFSLINPKIKKINITKDLLEINKINKQTFFHKFDGHYNINGYKVVSDIINEELKKLDFKP